MDLYLGDLDRVFVLDLERSLLLFIRGEGDLGDLDLVMDLYLDGDLDRVFVLDLEWSLLLIIRSEGDLGLAMDLYLGDLDRVLDLERSLRTYL